MRVFTQRFQISSGEPWEKPIVGADPAYADRDTVVTEFNTNFPGAILPDHPLDYHIVCDPPLDIFGYYWGDKLEAARAFIRMKAESGAFVTHNNNVISCDDDQHPTQLPIDQIYPLHAESGSVIIKYRLRSDPDTWISVA